MERKLSQQVAIKFDHDKNPLELLPADALWVTAWVLLVGKVKYAEDNWAKGMSWRRMYGSLLRHLFEWSIGIDKDRETGLPNLAHALCCLLFLLSYQLRKVGIDDRYLLSIPMPELPPETKVLIEDLRRAKEASQSQGVPEFSGQKASS